ncbi:uncharacterized protein LOC131036742 [Cryptomeria japonica]|uniref:uncharacterized protein LOC131036742 n=1 Tax=Cryptomeria japonica TaxID=3369 RepID=UPI0027D9FDD6|nr:uncharacterized protein LOC131036742 [Cryptomeria japonica]
MAPGRSPVTSPAPSSSASQPAVHTGVRLTRSRTASAHPSVAANPLDLSVLSGIQQQLQTLSDLFAREQSSRFEYQNNVDCNLDEIRRALWGFSDSSTDTSAPLGSAPPSAAPPTTERALGGEDLTTHGVQTHSAPDLEAPVSVSEAPAYLQTDVASNVQPDSSRPVSSRSDASLPEVPPENYPPAISSLVHTAFKDFKRRHLLADRSSDFLRKLKMFSDAGTLPKSLQLKPPKLSVNDSEGNSFLASEFEKIQGEANQRFLEAYISAIEKAHANHVKAIGDMAASFANSLASTIAAVKNQPYVGSFSVPADAWLTSAQASFDALCNNFVCEKALKKNARDAAAAVNQDARDAAMAEADQIPIEKSVAELINEQLNNKFNALQKKLDALMSNSSPAPLKSALRSKTKQRPLSAAQHPVVSPSAKGLHAPRPQRSNSPRRPHAPRRQPATRPPPAPHSPVVQTSVHTPPDGTSPDCGPSSSAQPAPRPKNGPSPGRKAKNRTLPVSGPLLSKPKFGPPPPRSVRFAEPLASSGPSGSSAQARGRSPARFPNQHVGFPRGRSRSRSNDQSLSRGFTRGFASA